MSLPIDKFLYFIGWVFYRAIFKIFWRLKVSGLENIPSKGGVIIASNHLSLADPPLIGASLPKPIFYMAKKELFEIPIFGWILKKVNAFPVDRNSNDLKAMKTAKKILQEGKTLLIFPQGGRRSEENLEAKNGVGILSCWAHVPVVPCCVINSNKLKKFARLRVYFSKPIFPPDISNKKNNKEIYREITQKVINEIKCIKEKMTQ
jgi:1-acyl-sn-glycerol-3-phosphate acyltransferase